MPIEDYIANPYNMVSLVGPIENARRIDDYFWDVRVGDIPIGPVWSVVPTCRIEMRFLPDRGMLVRSCRVALDPARLPVRSHGVGQSCLNVAPTSHSGQTLFFGDLIAGRTDQSPDDTDPPGCVQGNADPYSDGDHGNAGRP